jgi:LacI family transcriptional regulator
LQNRFVKTVLSADECADEAACIEWLEKLRWPNGVICIRCGYTRVYRIVSKSRSGNLRRLYECGACHRQFSVATATIIHNSHLPLRKWIVVLQEILNSESECSVSLLAQELDVHYRTARRVAGEIREALRHPPQWLSRGLEEMNSIPSDRRPSPGPKASSQGKRSNKSRTGVAKRNASGAGRHPAGIVGFVVPDLMNPFFTEIAGGLMEQVRKRGSNLLISSSGGNNACERQEIEEFLDLRVDSLVIISTQTSPALFVRLKKHGVRFVMVDREIPGLGSNYVGVNDEKVGMLAVSHLIGQGYRHIAHICDPRISTGIGRLKGYRQGLRINQIPERPGSIVHVNSAGPKAELAGYKAMNTLLTSRVHLDSVFCYNDIVAIGAMRAIAHAGLRVPDDIAVVGVGNIPSGELFKVSLTSIDQNGALIGQKAGQLVLSLPGGRTAVRSKRLLLPPVLIKRKSTSRLR